MSEEINPMYAKVIDTDVRLTVLEDRYDRHYPRIEGKLDLIIKNFEDERRERQKDKEELLKIINEVKLDAAKSEGVINTKLAVANGTIAFIVSGLTTWVSDKLSRGGQ